MLHSHAIILITTVHIIHIQMRIQIQYRRTLLFRYEKFIDFLTSAHCDTWRETQFLPCWPYYAGPTNARRFLWCLRSLSVEIRKTQLHLQRTKSNSQLLTFNWLFFKILKFSGPSLFGHDVSHTTAPFPAWGFIMTMVIVISFAHERKTVPNVYAPEILTRIVQSPTKLNDKI